MGINIYYFFASIYGWIMWNRHLPDSQNAPAISHTPKKLIAPLTLISVALFALIAFILIRYTNSPVPYGDSFTTALSIVGMWLLAQKYIEQWWFWLIVNVVSCGLYAWKDLTTTALLFAVYSVISLFGYFKWRRIMLNQSTSQPSS